MKISLYSKKDVMDEMQEQPLRKVGPCPKLRGVASG